MRLGWLASFGGGDLVRNRVVATPHVGFEAEIGVLRYGSTQVQSSYRLMLSTVPHEEKWPFVPTTAYFGTQMFPTQTGSILGVTFGLGFAC